MKTRIYQPHTHAGKRYVPGPKGMEIDLSEGAIAWLKQYSPGVLEAPERAKAPARRASTKHTKPKA